MHQKNYFRKLEFSRKIEFFGVFLVNPVENHSLKHESSQRGLQPPASVPEMAHYRKINGPLKAMCYQMR